jgi:hypothetical protein
LALVLVLVGAAAGCSGGAPATFILKSASVDATYDCPVGSTDAPYSLHGVIDMRNGTSSSITVNSVSAVMTLVAVRGTWLEKVGDKYEAAGVTSSVGALAAGGSVSSRVTVPSSCTRGKTAGPDVSYGEYSVAFTVITTSGTYSIQSANHHRVVAG